MEYQSNELGRLINPANNRVNSQSYDANGNWLSADGLLLGIDKLEIPERTPADVYYPVRLPDQERLYFGGRLLQIGGEWVTTDRLGSVVRKGTTNYKYAPYGKETGGATTNDTVKFATYTRDSVSGLDYALNRYYKPEWGRFTSPDPYQASGGPADPASWNRYTYVGGDPVNFNDPSGLFHYPIWSGGKESFVLYYLLLGVSRMPLDLPMPMYESASEESAELAIAPECDERNPANARVLSFIRSNQDSATTLAGEMGLSADSILASAAMESGWGTGSAATRNNNCFGLTTNNWPNAIACPEGAFAGFACFAIPEGSSSNLLPSGRSALSSANRRYLTPALQAQADGGGPAAIAAAIANAGFNSEHSDQGVTYRNSVQGTFNSIQRRRHCLEP